MYVCMYVCMCIYIYILISVSWKLQTHDTTSNTEAQATKEQQNRRHLASPKYIA